MKHYSPVALALAIAVSTTAQAETSLEERLAATEQRIASLESSQSADKNITINGFMTFAMERADAEDANGNDVFYQDTVGNQDWNLDRLTRAGVQINARVNDRTEAVVQVLGRAAEDFDAKVQWAYVSYAINESLTARAGRIVLPVYMHSQYRSVGYAYPWIEMPAETYSVVPLETIEALDLTWNFRTGAVAHSLNAFWGGTDVVSETATGTVTSEVRDQTGINLRSSVSDWTFWAAFTQSQTTLDLTAGGTIPLPPVLNMDHHYVYFGGLGVQYDNGSLFVMAERTKLDLSTPYDWFPTLDSSYITTGYRIGKWTPHVTWANVEHSDYDEVDPTGIPAGPGLDLSQAFFGDGAKQQSSWTFGTRYDLTPGVALKAEVTSAYGFTSTSPLNTGLFTSAPDDDKHAYVYRFAVETVF